MTRHAPRSTRAPYPTVPQLVDNHRSYRCTFTPRNAFGHLNPSDTGTAPFVQFHAANAEQALDIAQHVTGCPVIEAVRIEG
ncbi:hypothetical protein [Variovorax atrisoli]|uniref:hypothetical protein n=1 Tax=Variovorax atrisoli TaxID=3394203 RepID=UPI00404021E0